MHSHFHLCLFGRSKLKCLSRSLPYPWNFKHFSKYHLDNGKEDSFYHDAWCWCPTVQVPHTILCRVAAKNRAIYSSWISQQEWPYKNSTQAAVSIWVVHHILMVYCLSFVWQWVWLLWLFLSTGWEGISELGNGMAPGGAGLLLHYRTAMIASNKYFTQVLVS